MKNLWRLLALLRPFSGWMLLGVVVSAITLLANITLMAVSGWFIASMALAGVAGVSMNYFSPAAIIRAMAILRTGGRYAERLITHEATFRLLAELRVWIYRRLEPLAPAALEGYRSGDLLSRLRADIDSLDNLYIRVLVPLLTAFIGVTVTTLFIGLYDSLLAWVMGLMLLLAGLVLPLLVAHLGRQPGQDVVKQTARLRTQVIDGVQGMAELTVCGALEQNAQTISAQSAACIGVQRKLSRIAGISLSGQLLLANLGMWLVMLVAIPLVNSALIEPAELAMLALFSLAAFESVMPLPEALRRLGEIQAAASRLFEIVDRESDITDPPVAAAKPERFDIQLQQLSFRYRAELPPVLQDMDLSLAQGQKLAIVGATGAGKSSLIQLLLRDRLPQNGQILLGGQLLDTFKREQLRDWIAVVPQQVHLFNASIRENLLVANPAASRQQLEQVCRIAQLHQFIQQQPDGYDTWVGESGVKLSGGQGRRLAIARALLRDFELLVLDEPGEGLDSKTERQLMRDLIEAIGDKSLLLITHSQHSLDQMDKILLLEQGRIVEQGSYAQLQNQNGRFSRLICLGN